MWAILQKGRYYQSIPELGDRSCSENCKVTYLRNQNFTNLLYFSTLSVHYRIHPTTPYLRYGALDPVWIPNGRTIFHPLNRNNAISGYVLLPSS
jgi:hypothetical protein